MASSNISLPAPPVFTGKNYEIWAVKMKAQLRAYDLWDVVETGAEPPPVPANPTVAQMRYHSEQVAKRAKALTILHSAVDDDIFMRISNLETAKQVWDKLEEEFFGNERTKQMQVLNLKREFEALKMSESETIKDFMSRLMKVVNQIRLMGEEFLDSRIVEKVLVVLPEKFESKISSLEESKDLSKISLTELVNALQAQEQRRLLRQEEATEIALQVRHKGKGAAVKSEKKVVGENSGKDSKKKERFPRCGICKRTSHKESDCWFKGKTPPPIQCRYCNRNGHVEKFCRLKQQHQNQQSQPVQKANVTETEPNEELLFMAKTTRSLEDADTWFIDSGCTQHMTSKPEFFSMLEPATGSVKVGNGDKVAIIGKGIVQIHTTTGIKHISDVLLVPELDQNLLSVGQLMQNGYSLLFKERSCVINDADGHELFEVEMRKRCFPVNWNLMTEQECKVSKVELDSKLWHMRLGHYNLKSIQFAQKQELVKDLPNIQVCSEVCEGCQLGKQHRLPFPSSATWRATEKLQLVHSDVCGPMKTVSLNGSKYFILFIDDFTRMTWVYFLKQKSEVFSVFKKFKALVEAQCGCLLKKLRTDNGKEYTSTEFNMFCEDLGIEHQLTVSYSPQQNGVAERKNRSVLEMARCMMFEKKLPKSFWAEAVNTAVYLQNRLPTRAVQGMTPIEAWGDIKPSLRHLKVFGSLCYTHVPDVKRSKLDEKAEKGVLIGYSSQSKGYKVYGIDSGKVFISRDLKVDEDAYWNWETSQVQRHSVLPSLEDTDEDQNEDDDEEFAVRGTRPLSEIYQRCNSAVLEPTSFEDAIKVEEWNQAMKEEITAIEKNKTWQLVDKPEDKNVIGVKWVYRVKQNPNGSINKYKARLVVKGYIQQSGIDYVETFAPVARMDTIRVLVALAAQMRWKIWHLDVKSAFLNGNLAEDILHNLKDLLWKEVKIRYISFIWPCMG